MVTCFPHASMHFAGHLDCVPMLCCPHAVFLMTTIAILVCCFNTWAPSKWPRLCIAVQAHTLIGAALSLLLVFRTNASYARFTDGRAVRQLTVSVMVFGVVHVQRSYFVGPLASVHMSQCVGRACCPLCGLQHCQTSGVEHLHRNSTKQVSSEY